jgi:hypothetical protein
MSLRIVQMAIIRLLSARTPTPGLFTAGTLAAMAALGWIAAPSFAATYKWTDADGRVIYSDQPPTGDFKVESLNAPPPRANPNAVKELATKEAEVLQRRLLRAEEEKKAAKASLEAANKREQCSRARGQFAMLQANPNILYRSNEKGEPVMMDDAVRVRERQQLEAWLRENCST